MDKKKVEFFFPYQKILILVGYTCQLGPLVLDSFRRHLLIGANFFSLVKLLIWENYRFLLFSTRDQVPCLLFNSPFAFVIYFHTTRFLCNALYFYIYTTLHHEAELPKILVLVVYAHLRLMRAYIEIPCILGTYDNNQKKSTSTIKRG